MMDVHMPEMDGFEATKKIRAIEQYLGFKTPIFGMTADNFKGEPANLKKAREVGMNKVYEKPLTVAQIEEIIEKIN